MYAYSHLVWADKLRDRLGVHYPDEFNLGAVIPDLRYADALPWAQTHFADPQKQIHPERFWSMALQDGASTDLRDHDFALGYLLHLAMDRSWTWLVEQARSRHPLGRVLPPRALKIAIEAAATELYPLKDIPLSRRVPSLALQIGISGETIRHLRSFADEGLSNPSAEAAYDYVRQAGLANKRSIRLLMRLATVVARSPLRLPLVGPAKRILRELEPELERRFLEELRPFTKVFAKARTERVPPSQAVILQPAN
ncbi:MAG: zinc dependent phospholipase C family protein [Chloroflexia bacterium]|nr:zinc dependent phospholipase C family protein [Chloroflexia bacterium]